MQPPRYIQDTLGEFRALKKLADRALAQAGEADLFATLDPESNSIAINVKHIAGNLRSRWTDFLTTDGEKPDRNRDSEFVIDATDTKERLLERWESGWQILFDALESLAPEDLARTVLIRGEPHSVVQAINRQFTHYGYHVGQIVFLAKHLARERWRTLSVPRGKSAEFTATKFSAGAAATPKPPIAVGSISWTDLTVGPAAEVRDFYRAVVGWEASDVDMGGYNDFCMNEPGTGRTVAGVCHARGSNADLPPVWLVYVTVRDVDASAKRCLELGGAVLSGPKNMGGHGRYCVIRDPSGAVLALFQPAA